MLSYRPRFSFRRRWVVLALAAGLVGMTTLPSAATWTSTGVLISQTDYDYAPTALLDTSSGTVYKYWWLCKSAGNDAICYKTYTVGTGWSSVSVVFTKAASGWDSLNVGDPTVVKGSFTIGGGTHTYLMYYVGDSTAAPQSSIGVAYSDNGTTWTRYASNPIITCQFTCTGQYGAGQGSAYNTSGTNVTMVYVDTSTNGSGSAGTSPRLFKRTSTNGYSFGSASIITQTGLLAQNWQMQADVAYEASSSTWYLEVFNRYTGTATLPMERQIGLYKIADANLASGTWTYLGVVDKNQTGYIYNHNGGFLRNTNGSLQFGSSIINLYFSVGTDDVTTWDLSASTVDLTDTSDPTQPLYRYAGTNDLATISCADDLDAVNDGLCVGYGIPTGQGYVVNQTPATLGYALRAPNASGTVEVLSCSYWNGSYNDYYLSALPTGGDIGGTGYLNDPFAAQHCDATNTDNTTRKGNLSTTFIGTAGWLYTSSGAGRRALYSCYSPVIGHWDLYTSIDAQCETTGHAGNLLGYAKTTV